MATETRTKQAVRLTPKATPLPPDPHREMAFQITRNALDRYLAARADYEASDAKEDELETRPAVASVDWRRWDQGTTDYLNDSIRYLIRTILAWDPTSTFKTGTAQPPRGVIRDGLLYLALPDDPDHPLGESGYTELYTVPLASIVDLDREGGDR